MSHIVDRTPCNNCTHEDVCAHKSTHAKNVKNLKLEKDVVFIDGCMVDLNIDLVYISCSKFVPRSVLRREVTPVFGDL